MKTASSVSEDINKKVKRSIFRGKRRLIRYGLLSANLLLVVGIVSFVIATRNNDPASTSASLNLRNENELVSPLDELSGADIAVNIAEMVRMEQATAVRNNADTVNSQLTIVPNDTQVIAKPQIVETTLKSIKDLTAYKTVEGDTVEKVAKKFRISQDTVRWSNDLSGNTIAAGTTLWIPPVDGILYEVKDGDTAKKIAEKYRANEKELIAFNDAELTGFKKGQKIVIPDGQVPVTVARSVPVFSGFRFGSNAVYGYNGYDYGYCTWYAANRRAEVGKPIPANLGNASTWKVLAQRAGTPVGNTPRKYAVIWTPPRDYYGHVGFVEKVFEDGSVLISEMNTVGWSLRSTKILTAEQAAAYSYIY